MNSQLAGRAARLGFCVCESVEKNVRKSTKENPHLSPFALTTQMPLDREILGRNAGSDLGKWWTHGDSEMGPFRHFSDPLGLKQWTPAASWSPVCVSSQTGSMTVSEKPMVAYMWIYFTIVLQLSGLYISQLLGSSRFYPRLQISLHLGLKLLKLLLISDKHSLRAMVLACTSCCTGLQ